MNSIDLSGVKIGAIEKAAHISDVTESSNKVEAPQPEYEEEPKEEEHLSEDKIEDVISNLSIMIEDTEDVNKNDIEEDKKEGQEKKVDEKENPGDKPAESVYSVLAEFLKEKGVLPDSIEVQDEDTFIESIQKTIEAEKYKGLSDAQKAYLESIESGMSENDAKVISNAVKNLDSIDRKVVSEDKSLAEGLIKEDLKAQGWNDARIQKHIERLEKLGELEDEAMVSKENLKRMTVEETQRLKEEAEKAKKTRLEEEQNQVKALKDAIYKSDKVFENFRVDDRLKNKVYELMTTPVGKAPDGTPINALIKDRLEDVVDFEKRLYYAYTLTNGFRDIKKLQRKAENSAAKKLKAAVEGIGVDFTNKGDGVGSKIKTTIPNIVKL